MSSTQDQSNQQLSKDDVSTQDQSNQQLSKDDSTKDQSKQQLSKDDLSTQEIDLNLKNNKIVCLDMCFFCFDMLGFYLNLNEAPIPKFTDECYPLFVTWYTGKSKNLRGCIGNFTPSNLNYGLSEYAIISATQDPRFSPIAKDEFPELHCQVSILINFEEASNYLDWEIGKHGIRIEFERDNKIKSSATFLPDVVVEQNCNKKETIDQLIRKAGYKGVITEDLCKSIKLTRYQSEKVFASYEEYMKSKNNEI